MTLSTEGGFKPLIGLETEGDCSPVEASHDTLSISDAQNNFLPVALRVSLSRCGFYGCLHDHNLLSK